MGAWGTGAFDNDTAADWCNDLDQAPAEKWPELIRRAFTEVVDSDEYLDVDYANVAVAAAAVVASQRPDGEPVDDAYGPELLAEGGRVDLPADLDALAVRALDRVVSEDSEWRELWEESDSFDEALAVVTDLRATLAGEG